MIKTTLFSPASYPRLNYSCVYLSRLLILLVLATTTSLEADQTDPRLAGLFEALAETDNVEILTEVENRIWAIWYEHPNENAQTLLLTGVDYMNRQFAAEALAIFNQAVQQYPEYAEAWNQRATLHYLLGNLDDSIRDIDKTLELEPRHFGALSGLGLVYIQQQNLQKAQEAFENLLKVHPNSPAAIENLNRVNEAFRLNFI